MAFSGRPAGDRLLIMRMVFFIVVIFFMAITDANSINNKQRRKLNRSQSLSLSYSDDKDNNNSDDANTNVYRRHKTLAGGRKHSSSSSSLPLSFPPPSVPLSSVSSSSTATSSSSSSSNNPSESSVLSLPTSSSSSSISIITKGSSRRSSPVSPPKSSNRRTTSLKSNPYTRRPRPRSRNRKIKRTRWPQHQQQLSPSSSPTSSSISFSLSSSPPSSPLPYSKDQFEPRQTPSTTKRDKRRSARDRARAKFSRHSTQPSHDSNNNSNNNNNNNRRRQNSPPSHQPSSPPSSTFSSSWKKQKSTTRSARPNIVVIMTDDQDVLLGSLEAMPKLRKLMTRQGVYFNNSFVPTPMCCPSRSSFLTGMYVHNHNVYTNNDNCSSTIWQQKHESRGFATYINNTYHTGYFGKYLNEYTGTHTPAGWHRWEGLVKNTRYYNYYTVNEKGVKTRHRDNYYKDYLTDLVANDSCTFLQDSKRRFPDKPVMMMLSLPAPHGPEDAAPQYQHMFVNNTWHRTPTWNYAPNPDKQWLLQSTEKMIPQHKLFTDLLQRRRLQTLQSVDDLVEKVVQQLSVLGELSNTYIVYTSDHGYHLGQFGLIKGKAMPFDFDTRVPLIMRGPGIRPGSVISNIVSNIDLGPTIIDMAGANVPEHMDGQSILRLTRAARDRNNVDSRGFVTPKKPWRDTILLEKGKLTRGRLRIRMRKEEMTFLNQMAKGGSYHDALNFYIPQKTQELAMECSRVENRLPCKPKQKFYCTETHGKLRRHKCRHLKNNANNNNNNNQPGSQVPLQGDAPYGNVDSGSMRRRVCGCDGGDDDDDDDDDWKPNKKRAMKREQRRHRKLMRKQAKREFQARFSRVKRSVLSRIPVTARNGIELADNPSRIERELNGFESMFNRRCRILANQSVLCDLDIYQKASEWSSHKQRIDDMIKEYRKALEDLRDIRRHLIRQRPMDASYDVETDDLADSSDVDDGTSSFSSECDCDEADNDSGGTDITTDAADGSGVLDVNKKRPPPLRQQPLTRQERRKRKKQQRKANKKAVTLNPRPCKVVGMQCFSHNNDHWKTPPYWTYGPFCFCPNTANNTYWCLRTINQTHDFHYCEFLTTFMSFYDLHKDPFQMKNTVTELNYGILQQLHEELKKLRNCEGAKQCLLRSSQKNRLPHDPDWPGMVHLKRSWRLSRAFKYKYKDNYYDHNDRHDEHDDDEEEEEEEEDEENYSGEELYYEEFGDSPDYE